MPNFASIINLHNKKIINNNIPKPFAPTCNCCSKTSSPLNGDSLQSSLVCICKAVTPDITENQHHYIGLTENTFKDRFYMNKNSFKYESKRNGTELSWENEHANTQTNSVCIDELCILTNILDEARVYKPEAKRCFLCLTEKYHIIFSKLNLPNSRN